MKYYLLILSLFVCRFLFAQSDSLCIEKSSKNTYIPGNDTSLTFYKTVVQNGNNKVLLFTVRSLINYNEIPTIVKTDINGNVLWSRTIAPENYSVQKFEAISLHDNSTFIFCIAKHTNQNPDWINYMLWLDGYGGIIRQKSFRFKNNPVFSGSMLPEIKLAESGTRDILFALNYFDRAAIQSYTHVGNISATGNLQWSKYLSSVAGGYDLIDIITDNKYILLQGVAYKNTFPGFQIINSTKLNLGDGTFISGISHQDFSYPATYSTNSCQSVLTDDYKIKTLVSWRIGDYYEIYFAFTQDTSLNLLKSTTFYTTTSAISYLPASVMINKNGMSLIKTFGTFDRTNIGYFITDIDDNIITQKKVTTNSAYSNFFNSGINDVVFDNADSLYLYWNDKKNGQNIVGWIKTGIQNTEDFCGVKDSSFIQSAYYPMKVHNWKFTQFSDDEIDVVVLNVSISSSLINKEQVCEEITGFCMPIKIKPVDTVCSPSQPVTISVSKNPECKGPVLFRFDTLAVKDWKQLNDTTLILNFEKSWEGDIYATASFCPLTKDTMHLIVTAPLPQGITLGNDTLLCKGDSLYLHAEGIFASYTWQNGTTGPGLMVKDEGLYYITVKDNCNRAYSDSIMVSLINKKPEIGNDISICKKESVELNAKGTFASFDWFPDYNINSTTSQTVLVNPEKTTNYIVTAFTKEGCLAKDSVVIIVKDCPQTFFIPSAFTPNNDGRNDLFLPIVSAPLEKYEFSIYNRWGQRIFYSSNKLKGWDGKLGGIMQDAGVFVWVCSYKFYDKPAEFKKGTFTLIR